MYILAIETTGPYCSVTLIDENGNMKSQYSSDKLNHLKLLTPMIYNLIEEEGIKMTDISGIAASNGPGSFTGIRIGVSTARALGQSLDIPCIPIPSLYAFAKGQSEHMNKNTIVCPILDARRNQVYASGCINGEELIETGAYDIDGYLDRLDKVLENKGVSKIVFVGDGIGPFQDIIVKWATGKDVKIDMKAVHQHSEAVAREGLRKFKIGEVVGFNDFEPTYMRKSEAERKLEERLSDNG